MGKVYSVEEWTKIMKMAPAKHLVSGQTILCPKCLKEPAQFSEFNPRTIGIVYGDKCRKKLDSEWVPFGPKIELIPARIKEDRYKYKKDIVQPYREGVPSQEYAEAYPEKAKTMFKGQTPKRVWKGDVEGY